MMHFWNTRHNRSNFVTTPPSLFFMIIDFLSTVSRLHIFMEESFKDFSTFLQVLPVLLGGADASTCQCRRLSAPSPRTCAVHSSFRRDLCIPSRIPWYSIVLWWDFSIRLFCQDRTVRYHICVRPQIWLWDNIHMKELSYVALFNPSSLFLGFPDKSEHSCPSPAGRRGDILPAGWWWGYVRTSCPPNPVLCLKCPTYPSPEHTGIQSGSDP